MKYEKPLSILINSSLAVIAANEKCACLLMDCLLLQVSTPNGYEADE